MGILSEMSVEWESGRLGSVVIGIGVNSLGCLKDRIRVGNMLPAILIPCVYLPVAEWLKGLF